MDRNPRSETLTRGRLGQRFRILQTEHRRRKRKAQGVFFFSPIDAAHHQHTCSDAGIAQDDSLIRRGHPEPLCAFLLKRQRALLRAVSIGVALHHRADGDVGAYMLLQHPEIVTQGGKRNFSPIRPGLDARRCKGCDHLISIIQAGSGDSPAAKGLLNSSGDSQGLPSPGAAGRGGTGARSSLQSQPTTLDRSTIDYRVTKSLSLAAHSWYKPEFKLAFVSGRRGKLLSKLNSAPGKAERNRNAFQLCSTSSSLPTKQSFAPGSPRYWRWRKTFVLLVSRSHRSSC